MKYNLKMNIQCKYVENSVYRLIQSVAAAAAAAAFGDPRNQTKKCVSVSVMHNRLYKMKLFGFRAHECDLLLLFFFLYFLFFAYSLSCVRNVVDLVLVRFPEIHRSTFSNDFHIGRQNIREIMVSERARARSRLRSHPHSGKQNICTESWVWHGLRR